MIINDNYNNAIDRSIIRINQSIPEIMDRMLELYKAYAPKVLETLVQRLEENGGRLAAYKHELEKFTYRRSHSDYGISDFLDKIPFLSLVEIVEPSLHKVLMTKINEIASLCKSNSANMYFRMASRLRGSNNRTYNIDEAVNKAVQETEGFQRFIDFELTGVFPGMIPSYGCGNYDYNQIERSKNPNFNNNWSYYFPLPVIGIYNKFNINLFNKLFLPEARTLNTPFDNTGIKSDVELKHKHLEETFDTYVSDTKNSPTELIHQNILLVDVNSLFNSIASLWRRAILWNSEDTRSIDRETRKRIEEIFDNPGLFPVANNKHVEFSDIAFACKTFTLLGLNNTTSPEYKQYFREFDLLHNYVDEQWGLFKRISTASAITTYLANVCSRTQDFSNNMLDDVVNKYLSITPHDNFAVNATASGYKPISTIRSKANDFYALFRNFLNTPSLSQRNMLNFDDIALSRPDSNAFHMSVRDFAIYLIKKIYEHECVTYNTTYNISNTDTNFCFIQTEAMMKKVLMHVSSPEAKAIIEQYKNILGNKSLLGINKREYQSTNYYHPLAYLARNHRTLSSVYKKTFIAFISYIDAYRLKKNISIDNEHRIKIESFIWKSQRELVESIEKINEICEGRILFHHLGEPQRIAIRNLNKLTVLPAFVIGLYYDGKFNINYNLLNSNYDILLLNYTNKIIDVIVPKNLRRNHGFTIGHNRFVNSVQEGPTPVDDEEISEECCIACCDGGNVSYGGGIRLSDIDDLSAKEIFDRLGMSQYHGRNSNNIEINKTPYTDFGQVDAELDSGLNSYESLASRVSLKLINTPSLESVKKVSNKLNNLKILKTLDLATVAYAAQAAYEKLDFDKLSDDEKTKANEDINIIDTKLREVLNGRIYQSSDELNMNSMESIDFKDMI